MKWMIAATLVGSTALVPVAIENSEGIGSGNPATTNKIRSTDYFPSQGISSLSISSQILLDKWDSLSVEQQAEWQVTRDNLVREAEIAHQKAVREAEIAHKKAVRKKRIERLNKVIKAVVSRVGKTPYILSGSTPSGWDCSGLVKWTYNKLGITLPHSATAQLGVGRHVANPRKGDIVVWGGGYHSGIYLGNGKVVNALNPYRDTNIVRVDYLAGSVTYVRAYDY
jgi:cell wall-associated NlpC family hydrolase